VNPRSRLPRPLVAIAAAAITASLVAAFVIDTSSVPESATAAALHIAVVPSGSAAHAAAVGGSRNRG
jgi:hypothetical protein